MDRNLIWGMAIGLAATVIAYEVWERVGPSPDTEPAAADAVVEAAAGPTRDRAQDRTAPRARAPLGDDPTVEQLLYEVDALAAEVERLQLESTLARGQLAHYEGEALPWPEDLPEGLSATGFEAAMQAAEAEMEHGELVEVDCGEFPCVAIFESGAEGDDWHRGMVDVLPGGEDLGVEGELGTMVWASEAEGAEGRARLLGVSMVPEGQLDEDARTRLEFRAGMLLEDQAEQALQPRP